MNKELESIVSGAVVQSFENGVLTVLFKGEGHYFCPCCNGITVDRMAPLGVKRVLIKHPQWRRARWPDHHPCVVLRFEVRNTSIEAARTYFRPDLFTGDLPFIPGVVGWELY